MVHKRVSRKRYVEYNPEQLDELSRMEYNLDFPTFIKHYKKVGGDEVMGKHLWGKFHSYNHSFLAMFGSVDDINQKLLTKTLNSILKERKEKNKVK